MFELSESYGYHVPVPLGSNGRNKLNESYISRNFNNTVEWIIRQSPLERFFYVVILMSLITLFVLMYVFLNEAAGGLNTNSISANFLVDNKTLSVEPDNWKYKKLEKEVDSTSINNNIMKKESTTPMPEVVTKPPIKPVTEPSIKSVSEPSIKSVTEPSIKSVSEPETKSVSEPETKSVSEPETKPPIKPVTEPSIKSVTEPSIKLVAESRTQLMSGPVTKTSRGVEATTEKPIKEPSLCALIGLNHLAALHPLFNSTMDYYWYKPSDVKINHKKIQSEPGHLTDPIQLYSFARYRIDCKSKADCWNQIKSNFKQPQDKLFNKLSTFWESCLSKKNDLNSYYRLLDEMGLNKDNISRSTSRSPITSTLDHKFLDNTLANLEKYGLSNGLFYSKPISNYFPVNGSLSWVGRDDYPHFKNTRNQSRYLSDEYLLVGDSFPKLGLKDLMTALLIAESFEEKTFTNAISQPQQSRNFKLNKIFAAINESKYLIEYPSGYLGWLHRIIKNEPKSDLTLYLLYNSWKKNLIHFDPTQIPIYSDLFGPIPNDRRKICSDMIKFPFGFILLSSYVQINNKTLTSQKLAKQLIDIFSISFQTKYGDIADDILSRITVELSAQINELVTNDQIQFDYQYLDKVYESLHISDSYFESVQTIRGWFRKGYTEGCTLNYATI